METLLLSIPGHAASLLAYYYLGNAWWQSWTSHQQFLSCTLTKRQTFPSTYNYYKTDWCGFLRDACIGTYIEVVLVNKFMGHSWSHNFFRYFLELGFGQMWPWPNCMVFAQSQFKKYLWKTCTYPSCCWCGIWIGSIWALFILSFEVGKGYCVSYLLGPTFTIIPQRTCYLKMISR